MVATVRVGRRFQTVCGHHTHAGQAIFAGILQPVAIGVVEDLAGHVGAIEGRIGHDANRRGGLAGQRAAGRAVHRLRAIHELAFADAGADGEQHHDRALLADASMVRSFQTSSRPATVGSAGTPSIRADPGT